MSTAACKADSSFIVPVPLAKSTEDFLFFSFHLQILQKVFFASFMSLSYSRNNYDYRTAGLSDKFGTFVSG